MQAKNSPISGDSTSHGGRQYRFQRRARGLLYNSSVNSLWNMQGVPVKIVAGRTWNSLIADRIFGIAARSAQQIYDRLLDYFALLIPTAALGTVLQTFNQTADASTSGKFTFGLIAAIWAASAGISAIQDTVNVVYKIHDSRSYITARIHAIGLTILLTLIVTGGLASMLGGDVVAALALRYVQDPMVEFSVSVAARIIAWALATALLSLTFAVIYYWAPDVTDRRWHWLTPGGAVGLMGWLLASLGLRVYIHYFKSFSPTYGSLGAVMILLMWFYMTGLMLLLGAEINSEIDAAAAEAQMNRLRISPVVGQNVDA